MSEQVAVPKSYRRLSSKEIRHRAGLAWKRGQEALARALEALAITRAEPRDKGGSNPGRGTAYPTWLPHGVISHRGMVRGSYGV